MADKLISSYIDENGFDPVTAFIDRLNQKQQEKVRVLLRQLSNTKTALQPPLVKVFRLDWYKGLYELRARIRLMIRIIFFTEPDGRIVLLHGFVKKQDRSTEQALETARARRLALANGEAGTKIMEL